MSVRRCIRVGIGSLVLVTVAVWFGEAAAIAYDLSLIHISEPTRLC